jgi:hypothetical protein
LYIQNTCPHASARSSFLVAAERGRAEKAERSLSFSNSQINAARSAQLAPETLQTLTSGDPLFSQPSHCSCGGCSGIAAIRRTGQLGHCGRAGESSSLSIDSFSSARPEQTIRPISSTPPAKEQESQRCPRPNQCAPFIHASTVSDYSPIYSQLISHTTHIPSIEPALPSRSILSAPTISFILPQSTTLSFHLHLCCNSALIKFIQH